MDEKKYFNMLLLLWLLLLPIAAYIESLLSTYTFYFFLVIGVIESFVFWVGIIVAYVVTKNNMGLKKYVIWLFSISILLIPGASILENLFLTRFTLWFYLFINTIHGLSLMIGLFIGYFIGTKNR